MLATARGCSLWRGVVVERGWIVAVMMPEGTLLVVPCYNDVARLSEFLPELVGGLPGRFRVLVSDDGSEEGEREALRELVGGLAGGGVGVEVVFAERNTGKGGAVMRGWGRGEGCDLLAFVDADGAVGVGEVVRAEEFLRSGEGEGVSALFGSRVKMLGRTVERSLGRHLSGRVFATLVSSLGGVPAYDTQCGLKIVRRGALERIGGYLECEGFAFDVELCLLLRRAGLAIVEFPVDWRDVPGSKVSLVRDAWRMAWEVVRIVRRVEGVSL